MGICLDTNRILVPGWYGAGSSFEQLISIRGELGKELLQELYNKHSLFRLILDSVEKTLLLVDMEVAENIPNWSQTPITVERFFQT